MSHEVFKNWMIASGSVPWICDSALLPHASVLMILSSCSHPSRLIRLDIGLVFD